MLPKYATSRKTNENVLPFSTHYRLKIQPERNIIFLERTLGKGTKRRKSGPKRSIKNEKKPTRMCIRYQTVVASTAFSRNSSREAARSQQPCSSRYTFLITRWIYSWHPAWRLTSSSTATTTMSLCVRAKKFGSPLAVFLSRGILFSSVLRPAEPRQLVVQSRKKLGSELFHDNYQADETRAKRSNSSPDISG